MRTTGRGERAAACATPGSERAGKGTRPGRIGRTRRRGLGVGTAGESEREGEEEELGGGAQPERGGDPPWPPLEGVFLGLERREGGGLGGAGEGGPPSSPPRPGLALANLRAGSPAGGGGVGGGGAGGPDAAAASGMPR